MSRLDIKDISPAELHRTSRTLALRTKTHLMTDPYQVKMAPVPIQTWIDLYLDQQHPVQPCWIIIAMYNVYCYFKQMMYMIFFF